MKHEINKIGQFERVSFINFIHSRMLTTYSDTNETENTILNFYPSRHVFSHFFWSHPIEIVVAPIRDTWPKYALGR